MRARAGNTRAKQSVGVQMGQRFQLCALLRVNVGIIANQETTKYALEKQERYIRDIQASSVRLVI